MHNFSCFSTIIIYLFYIFVCLYSLKKHKIFHLIYMQSVVFGEFVNISESNGRFLHWGQNPPLWGSKGHQRQGEWILGQAKKQQQHTGKEKVCLFPLVKKNRAPLNPPSASIKILFGHVQYVCKNVSKHLLVECTPCFIGNMSCSKSKILGKMENVIVNRFKKAGGGRLTYSK